MSKIKPVSAVHTAVGRTYQLSAAHGDTVKAMVDGTYQPAGPIASIVERCIVAGAEDVLLSGAAPVTPASLALAAKRSDQKSPSLDF